MKQHLSYQIDGEPTLLISNGERHIDIRIDCYYKKSPETISTRRRRCVLWVKTTNAAIEYQKFFDRVTSLEYIIEK